MVDVPEIEIGPDESRMTLPLKPEYPKYKASIRRSRKIRKRNSLRGKGCETVVPVTNTLSLGLAEVQLESGKTICQLQGEIKQD